MPAYAGGAYSGTGGGSYRSYTQPYDSRAYNRALAESSKAPLTFGAQALNTMRARGNQLADRSAQTAAGNLAFRFGGNMDNPAMAQGLMGILTGRASQSAQDFANTKIDVGKYNNDVQFQHAAGLRGLAGIEMQRNEFNANNDWRNRQIDLEKDRWEYEKRREMEENMFRQQVMSDWGKAMLTERRMNPTANHFAFSALNPISMAYPQMMLNKGGSGSPGNPSRVPGGPGFLSGDSPLMDSWGPNRYYGYQPPAQNTGNGGGGDGNSGGGGDANGGKKGYMDKYGMGYTR